MATRRSDSSNTESRVPRSAPAGADGSTKPSQGSQPNQINTDSLRPVEPASRPSAVDPSRDARISEAAYYRAERRGFAEGGEIEDWLSAEREIDGESP